VNAATSTFANPVFLPPRWLAAAVAHMSATWIDRDTFQPQHIDPGTALLNGAGFRWHGDRALESSRDADRALAIVVFDCSDLLEIREIYGSRISRMVMERMVAKLRAATPAAGFAARTGQAEFTIVMPGCKAQKALRKIQRVFGCPARVEMDAADSEIVMIPDFRVDIAGTDTGNIDELRAELGRDIGRARKAEERRQRHLQRERESHSRPMVFAASAL
jgi:GGDEF domain-containing protein